MHSHAALQLLLSQQSLLGFGIGCNPMLSPSNPSIYSSRLPSDRVVVRGSTTGSRHRMHSHAALQLVLSQQSLLGFSIGCNPMLSSSNPRIYISLHQFVNISPRQTCTYHIYRGVKQKLPRDLEWWPRYAPPDAAGKASGHP